MSKFFKIMPLIVMAFAGAAQADTIGLHLVSKHAETTFERRYQDGTSERLAYNNTNPGIYYIADSGLTVGTYHNSYNKPTVYAGWTFYGPKAGPLSTSLSLALATGYSNVYGTGVLRPMALPSVSVATPLGLSLRYSAAPGKGGFLQHVSIERNF